ncbi:YncE family protein [Aquirhabdus sp.]|uniref:YncE family protein n=1 Tax=Aquirhabdus sp. TaxID=2824160 RepID=UPI00396CC3DE
MKRRMIPSPRKISTITNWALVLGGLFFAAFTSVQATPTLQNIGYIPVSSTGSVYVVDMQQQKVLQQITNVGDHPTVLRALPDHSKIYVDNFGPLSSQIAVIDTATNTVTKKISTNGAPFASMQLSPDGRYLYVPTDFSVMHVIDTKTDQIIRTFSLPALPLGVEVSADGAALYVTFIDSTVGAFDALNGAVIHPKISSGGIDPGWGALSADGRKLYLANALSDNIAVLDTVSWKITNTISVGIGGGPISVSLTPNSRALYVCNIGTHNITIIDTATEKVSKVIATGTVPVVVGFNPDGSRAYLSDLGQASIGYVPVLSVPLITIAFFAFLPGLSSDIVTYDTATSKVIGKPIITNTGPVVGLYF